MKSSSLAHIPSSSSSLKHPSLSENASPTTSPFLRFSFLFLSSPFKTHRNQFLSRETMNRALSRAAGATTSGTAARQAAPTPRLAGNVVAAAPLSIRSSAQLSRRRLGDSLIVRNELNKWCVPGRVAIAGRAGLPEREPGCFVWSTTESSFFLLLIFSRSL